MKKKEYSNLDYDTFIWISAFIAATTICLTIFMTEFGSDVVSIEVLDSVCMSELGADYRYADPGMGVSLDINCKTTMIRNRNLNLSTYYEKEGFFNSFDDCEETIDNGERILLCWRRI